MRNLFHREPGFYKRLFLLALPMVLQNLITTSLGFVDTFMVGLVGSNELSAVTAANTPIFLLQVTIFGLMSGLTVLVSQYWGQHDVESINRCMGVVIYLGLAMSSAAAAILLTFPTQVMSIVTDNPLLIELGAPYLRIVGVSYVFNAVSSVYVSMQRSTENPMFGMLVFGTSMLANTILNYILIFGKLGLPALGITGAAIATLTSRVLEFVIALVYALRCRRIPVLPKALLFPGFAVLRNTLKYSGPVMINEFMWGLGTSTLTSIMGHMTISADMLAAHAIMGNICHGRQAHRRRCGKRRRLSAGPLSAGSFRAAGSVRFCGTGCSSAHSFHPHPLSPVPADGNSHHRGHHPLHRISCLHAASLL